LPLEDIKKDIERIADISKTNGIKKKGITSFKESDDTVKTSRYELKVAAQDDTVYVIATGGDKNQTTYQPDVFIRVSNDSGKTFGKDIKLSESKGIVSERTEIGESGDNGYVTWWDKRTNGSDTHLY
jgi:hypothetical protein